MAPQPEGEFAAGPAAEPPEAHRPAFTPVFAGDEAPPPAPPQPAPMGESLGIDIPLDDDEPAEDVLRQKTAEFPALGSLFEDASPAPEQNFFAGVAAAPAADTPAEAAEAAPAGPDAPAPEEPAPGEDLFAEAQPPTAFTAEEAERAIARGEGKAKGERQPTQKAPKQEAHSEPRSQRAAPAKSDKEKKAAMVAQIAQAAQQAEDDGPAAPAENAAAGERPFSSFEPAGAPEAAPVQRMPVSASRPQGEDGQPVQRYPIAGPSSATRTSTITGPLPDMRRAYRPQREAPAEPPRRVRRRRGSVVRTVLVAILVFVLLTLVATWGILYYKNRPALTIVAFAEALSARDINQLDKLSQKQGVTATNEEGWEALCDAFSDPAKIEALKGELANLSAADENLTYPALRLDGADIFPFVKAYKVQIRGVELVVPEGTGDTVLRLNGVDHTGTADPRGALYMGVMPGAYTAQVDGGAEMNIEAFTTTQPTNVASNEAPPPGSNAATIELLNCLNDDATLYVSDIEMVEKPSNGIAVLQAVPLGSEIRIVAVQDGKTMESSVFFTDPAVTQLSFGNYVETAAASSSEADSSSSETEALSIAAAATDDQLNAVLAEYYKSYLQCINDQSMNPIQHSTDANNEKVKTRIASEANKSNIFTFKSASMDAPTRTNEDLDGVPSITFTANFAFSYKPRDNASTSAEPASEDGGNQQTVQIINVNGQWLVNSVA